MRVAIILGRGCEGCGVTRCAIETAKGFGLENATIFATVDKPWPRGKLANFKFTEFRAGDTSKKSDIKKGILTRHLTATNINQLFDAVLIFSVPSVKHPDSSPQGFLDFVKSIKKPKVMLQFDHNIMSIRRNANFKELCENVDALMTHSLTNPYANWLKEIGVQTPLHKMTLGFDFDAHKALYWKPIEEQDDMLVRWIGRLAAWKHPRLMIDFHNWYLRDAGYITVLEGLEASIGYLDFVTDKQKDGTRIEVDVINKFRARPEKGETMDFVHGQEQPFSPPYLYPPYDNKEAMERMSRSAFGSDLYQLKPKAYGNNIENCHAEIIACGAIPIFHKHFGENVIHRRTGRPVIQDVSTGTLFLDETSMDDVILQMFRLSKDRGLRSMWRHQAFEYWKSHADISQTVDEISQLVNRLITSKNQSALVTAE
jgi:hypothetical protein